ncbi:MAG: phosphatase PAP2 family protein [Chitinophagaceae bacterium]|nr:MAG: phosphatase PAP2 family protein [Chitinophagaceae bacterium]
MTFKTLGTLLLALATCFFSCKKDNGPKVPEANTYSAEVVTKWLGVQTGMLNRPTGNPFGFNPGRYMAYCGIALYEAILPGMPANRSLYGQLTSMPEMPEADPGLAYHWPTAAHAALAAMTRKFYSGITAAYNETAVNNLETELNTKFMAEAGSDVFERSAAFGTEVANRIYTWAQTDNAGWPTTPYQLPPYYPGMWMPETGSPVNPYGGYTRLLVPGSLDDVASPPLAYSTDPTSPYYKDMQEVYTVSQNLTAEQKLIAKYYVDSNPGYPAGAHYVSILKQVMEQLKPSLEKAALTYAKTGISLCDAVTGSFKVKYTHLAERPFQFIRTVIVPTAIPQWQPYLPTPGFPDFPSNHAIFSNSVAYALSSIYGDKTAITNSTYEGVMADMGNGPQNLGKRQYASFDAMADEISISRLYGGIHYRYSCEEGAKQGRKTAQNVETKLNFLK